MTKTSWNKEEVREIFSLSEFNFWYLMEKLYYLDRTELNLFTEDELAYIMLHQLYADNFPRPLELSGGLPKFSSVATIFIKAKYAAIWYDNALHYPKAFPILFTEDWETSQRGYFPELNLNLISDYEKNLTEKLIASFDAPAGKKLIITDLKVLRKELMQSL